MPLGNLSELLLYDLLPPVIQTNDARQLIAAVVGGFQDRIGDLRYFTSNIANFMDPWSSTIPLAGSGYQGPRTILVSFLQENSQIETTISLLDDGTAPPDGPALLTWCATELNLDSPSQVLAAVTGSDALRTLTVNQIELLADSLGATLYPGLPNELPAQTASRQAQIVQSFFPRLKIKGTSRSFSALAHMCGYEGTFIPLWSRLSPSNPADLIVASAGDFRSIPDYYPTAVLPDPAGFYNPDNLRDGPWFSWTSGTLFSNQSSPSYYTTINGQNPFITLVPDGSITGLIQSGTYTMAGGDRQAYASAPLVSGYYDSGLIAQALLPGATFNGMSLVVNSNATGSFSTLSVYDQLSSVKFRSSYYDADIALSVALAGTTLVQVNPYLLAGNQVVDGSSTAPWRPWGGGQTAGVTTTLWPDNEGTTPNASVPFIARTQVPINTTQLDMANLTASAQRVLALAQTDAIAATRQPRHLGAGPLWQDSSAFAPYQSLVPINYSAGSNYGSVYSQYAPVGNRLASWMLNGVAVASEAIGSQVYLESPFITGSYNTTSNTYVVWANSNATGQLAISYSKLDYTQVNVEPTLLQKTSGGTVTYQSYPAGTWVPPFSNVALSGSATEGQSSSSGTTVSPLTYMTSDQIPWQKLRILAGGDKVDYNSFYPFNGDPTPITTTDEQDWLDQNNAPQWLRVVDTPGAATPYKVRAVANSTPGPINRAYGTYTGPNSSGTQINVTVPMRLVGNMPIAADALLPARTDSLSWWWPLTDTASSHLTVHEALSGVNVPLVNGLPSDRVYNPTYGWTLQTWGGAATSPQIKIGANYSYGVRVIPSSNPNPYANAGAPVTVGALSLYMQGSTSVFASLLTSPGTSFNTGTVAVVPNRSNYVYSSYNNGTVNLLVRQNGSGVFTGSSLVTPSPVNTAQYVGISAANPVVAMQDLSVWSSGTKTPAQLTVVDTPNFTATAVNTPLPYSYSLRGDRYSFSVLAQGFAVPGPVHSDVSSRYEDATVIRYGGDGGYDTGDPEFKRVGLGENQLLPAIWQLGNQAAQPLLAHGHAVFAGTQPPLPAYTASFKGTAGSIDWQGPSPTGYGSTGGTVYTYYQGGTLWQQDLNTVLDRIYLVGSDGSAYDCYVDNIGFGPVFVSSLVARNKIFSQNGVITADCPTDHMSSFYSGGSIIVPSGGSVSSVRAYETGTVVSTASGSGYPVDAYMYTNSQLVATVNNAYSVLSNPTPFALGNNVASLNAAGDMTFLMNEYAGGPAPLLLNMLVGNIGQLDPDFDGFQVTITVEAPNMSPVVVPAVLLPNGFGYNPQAWQTISIPITTSLTGAWTISVDWTNDRTVPSRGWQRQLAIYSFTARVSLSNLVHITTNPLSLNQVSVFSPTTPIQPGAWVMHMTNSGTLYPATHESVTYSPLIDNPFNYPLNPACNSLTGSTASRFSDLRTVSTYTKVNAAPPAAPVINSVVYSPSGTNYLYNVGQSVTINANVSSAAGPLRYVWNMWDAGTNATLNPSYTEEFLTGGTKYGYMTAVDNIGQTATWAGTFVVNNPPIINAAAAYPNDQIVPYYTSLQAFVNSGTNPYTPSTPSPYNINWYSSTGSLFATGSVVPNYYVNQSGSVNVVVNDNVGGTSAVSLYVASEPAQAPVISIADYTANAYVNIPFNVQIAALGQDPNNEGLTPLWTYWDGVTSTGYVQPLVNFGTGSLFTTSRVVNVANPGYYSFSFGVTDTSGLTATVGAGINFTVNQPPVITSCTVTNGPQAIAGTPVYLAGAAVSPVGNAVNYSWTINPGNVVLPGPNVSYNTTGLPVGTVITATLTVSDNYLGVASQTLPGITVNSQGLANVTLHPPSSELQGAANVIITQPTNFNNTLGNIQYTINGITPMQATDGITYTGPFQVNGISGATVVVQARAFQNGFAPSAVVTSTYTFA